jgi:hypothetical protein
VEAIAPEIAPAGRRRHDPDQRCRSTAEKAGRMARRLSTIDVAAIVIIVLSVAVLAFVGFSIWAEP